MEHLNCGKESLAVGFALGNLTVALRQSEEYDREHHEYHKEVGRLPFISRPLNAAIWSQRLSQIRPYLPSAVRDELKGLLNQWRVRANSADKLAEEEKREELLSIQAQIDQWNQRVKGGTDEQQQADQDRG